MIFDARDKLILKTLQSDCRLSNTELAEKTNMSTSACWRKVRALEDNQVIEGYRATISPSALKLDFHAIVQVKMVRHSRNHLADFLQAVATRDEIVECFATTGDCDYQLRILCNDISAYNRFLEDFFFDLEAVDSTRTIIVLNEVKKNNRIPI
jgi:DNA-binding Lrp family transcriptional regulator